MSESYQLHLFGEPGEPLRRATAPVQGDPKQETLGGPGELRYASSASLARPTERKKHEERLAELNLRYGCTYVYHHQGQLYAWGDLTHCPKEDIEHNIRVLTQMLLKEGLSHAGKAYDSDLYQGGGRLDWSRITSEVRALYREPLLLINSEGEITGEATLME